METLIRFSRRFFSADPNYHELWRELKANGHIFTSDSDSEVIIHGYEEWQQHCWEKLNGMFAIALYD